MSLDDSSPAHVPHWICCLQAKPPGASLGFNLGVPGGGFKMNPPGMTFKPSSDLFANLGGDKASQPQPPAAADAKDANKTVGPPYNPLDRSLSCVVLRLHDTQTTRLSVIQYLLHKMNLPV
jgi:hypothetical protein